MNHNLIRNMKTKNVEPGTRRNEKESEEFFSQAKKKISE